MSQCKKFAPNIFHKTKCSNCFRQKEEHSAEALECNRASRSVARSGYLFVAPDWDFSVPLNRTKRWQRRWFVLYDDGELNYSVDEHPDTIPQGSVDMSKVLEVTAAEQITGHPHSVALTSPDRVTFIKAASREDARWWVELLAMFPRRHKRNATFPGGRASPSLPQLGRSASPQPPRPRFLSCTTSGPSPRTNFETPPLKEERESVPKDEQLQHQQRPNWLPEPTQVMAIDVTLSPATRNDYVVVSSGSPPTRDKSRCSDNARARRDWRNERLRDIATALTDRSPESTLALPAEGLLHLKKGWLWLKTTENEWARRWIVLCVPTLTIYRDQDEQADAEHVVELASVTSYNELTTDTKYGFEVHCCSGRTIVLSAVTHGIRLNWLEALKRACPSTQTTPWSSILSSDDEYKTASEHDQRRCSSDWTEPTSPFSKIKDRARLRPRQPTRQNTVDSTSTDELDSVKQDRENMELNRQNLEIHDLQVRLATVPTNDNSQFEEGIARLKKVHSEAMTCEKRISVLMARFERNKREFNERNADDQKISLETTDTIRKLKKEVRELSDDVRMKQQAIIDLQQNLAAANQKCVKLSEENDSLKEMCSSQNRKQFQSLSSLVDIGSNIERLCEKDQNIYLRELKSRLDRAIIEIRSLKKKLKEEIENRDLLEIVNVNLKQTLQMTENQKQSEINLLVNRMEYLTCKLNTVEKQLRFRGKTEKRRSLSLKGGKESFSINKEVEDKVNELEAKIVALERGKSRRRHKREDSGAIDDRSLRRLRRKSLDGALVSEPLKILSRLSGLETKVTSIDATSTESLTAASDETDAALASTNSVVQKLEHILGEKLADIYNRRIRLIDEGVYDKKAKLDLIAEKIAFENVMIARIQEAFTSDTSCDRLIEKQIKETANLIDDLKKKITSDQHIAFQPPQLRTSAEYLSRVLAKNLLSLTTGKEHSQVGGYYFPKCGRTSSKSFCALVEEQTRLEDHLSLYKTSKLPQLAELLALETLRLLNDKCCQLQSSTVDSAKYRLSESTREKVKVELMKAEINHILFKTAHVYLTTSSSDQNCFFSFFAAERACLELWADMVEDRLYQEIGNYVADLSECYKNSLKKLQRQNWRRKVELERTNETSSTLLDEFADVVAHKALIDARVRVLSGKFKSGNENDIVTTVVAPPAVSFPYERNAEAEFACLLDRRKQNINVQFERPEVETVLGCLNDVSTEISQLQHKVKVRQNGNGGDDATIFRDWSDLRSKCWELKEKLVQIRLAVAGSNFVPLRSYGQEEKRSSCLGAEYLSQVENLRSAYRCVITSCKDSRFENDIEQLKSLCERVLVTMEQWHHRTTQEMREKHARELEVLRKEKEQALKEETQATLAALDAMRKAHEAEVQKEVAKFKEELTRQQRDEVLELSEKLSVKRLEAAALSEQLGSASRQLAHAQQHILSLEKKPQIARYQQV